MIFDNFEEVEYSLKDFEFFDENGECFMGIDYEDF